MMTVIYHCDRCNREIAHEQNSPLASPLIIVSADEELCPECYAKYKAIMDKAKKEWKKDKEEK